MKECRFCKDRTKCEYAMNDYPGFGNLWKSKKYCEKNEKQKVETISENDNKVFKKKVENYFQKDIKFPLQIVVMLEKLVEMYTIVNTGWRF